MTSTRSTFDLAVRAAVIPGAIMGFMALTGAPAPLIALAGLFLAFMTWADVRRRSTLRRRDDGTYVWIEWHGGTRCSDTDPSEPGGAWDSDGDVGDGGGD